MAIAIFTSTILTALRKQKISQDSLITTVLMLKTSSTAP